MEDDADVFHDLVARVPDAAINRVAVKIPPFWPEHSELWLSQIEAQFILAGITSDDTKFNTVLASIEAPVLARISDAVVNQPSVGKYENLKSCILERFCESEQKKIQKLISEIYLGDKRPSHLLNELSSLAANKVNESFLKALWMQRLPAQVQTILQVSDASLSDLAKLADKVEDVGDFHNVRTVDYSSKSLPPRNTDVDDRLERIEQQISALLKNSSSKNNRSTSTRRSSSATTQDAGQTSSMCWYHSKFGSDAQKCRQPYSFSSQTKN
ncbi:uncharacterized protein LOC122623732 [Drosophila teissieri]|uniref:uncharacterized protein LOC122623732 n=1 Tax=Drosophila teissieri TaxID=7243 RepID=UPI001CB9FD2F|nr:uncharacterized protein LOC122623732 [Drosophila teissieri]